MEDIVEQLATMLPAQGPITVFIHHNTLHAFEDLPFEEAVVAGGERLGCNAFLSQDRYRAELATGRITHADIKAVLQRDLSSETGDFDAAPVFMGATRLRLRELLASHGIPDLRGKALAWTLSETSALDRYRDDVRDSLPTRGAKSDERRNESSDEARALRGLWNSCNRAAVRAERAKTESDANARITDDRSEVAKSIEPRRHRDLLAKARGIDIDDSIHPILIRFVGAYLDQGLASEPMPLRERGLRDCFLELYGGVGGSLIAPWGPMLKRLIARDREIESAAESLEQSLAALGVPEREWPDFMLDTALALRGWAGMVRQIEERPDRVPAFPVPARLIEFLAVRLLVERAALANAITADPTREDALSSLREQLLAELEAARRTTPPERGIPEAARTAAATEVIDGCDRAPTGAVRELAWQFFQVAQLCGVESDSIDGMQGDSLADLDRELRSFDATARQRVLHLAYERQFRNRFYDALLANPASGPRTETEYQAIFCIDEREESLRRHLEEIDPTVETFGAAGFFGVAMYYQAATDAHPRPLCPVNIIPEHFVGEDSHASEEEALLRKQRRRRNVGVVARATYRGSRTLALGALLTSVFGVLSAIPLVLRVLFPRLAPLLFRSGNPIEPRTRLLVAKRDDGTGPEDPPIGSSAGYRPDEMMAIVKGILETMGLADRLTPLVLVVGHGSVSLNNPHESAHDCGACGGGRGGPNARAFAEMANDPEVRRLLANAGFTIPSGTHFVGAERNTCNSKIEFFDLDRLPESHSPAFERARASIDLARDREAHERCRRFDLAPSWLSPRASRLHVEERAADIAQPRPEYGHASNALCMVGRRERTLGLFLDRRSFLVSYDPICDPEGNSLAGLLNAVVPVVAGINLEYYFSYIDPSGYGCGTKLPHNVSSLLGVMDGAQSDLRTGLPWQMVEIHEPVRLTMVVECQVETLQRIIRDNPMLDRLIRNRWVFVACLDPGSSCLHEIDGDEAAPYEAESAVPHCDGDSFAVYHGKQEHLPFTLMRPSSPDSPQPTAGST